MSQDWDFMFFTQSGLEPWPFG